MGDLLAARQIAATLEEEDWQRHIPERQDYMTAMNEIRFSGKAFASGLVKKLNSMVAGLLGK